MDADDFSLRPNPSRFLNVCRLNESSIAEPDLKNTHHTSSSDLYQPLRLTPVFYEPQKNSALKRLKKRVARFVLEDPDFCGDEDLPKEIHFGAFKGDSAIRKKFTDKQKYEEDNFTRLQITKDEKRLQRRSLSGRLPVDLPTQANYLDVLLHSVSPFSKARTALSESRIHLPRRHPRLDPIW
ncbi:unnamed protein product [Dicrocoelium dendriticum]|nr:unnamed protein product [Dicrocoelium dendriticum]